MVSVMTAQHAHGPCQCRGCTNSGNRTRLVGDARVFPARDGLPAGQRWFCDSCTESVVQRLKTDPLSIIAPSDHHQCGYPGCTATVDFIGRVPDGWAFVSSGDFTGMICAEHNDDELLEAWFDQQDDGDK